jgi:2-dehydro-3-deoxyphosphogluconate aldolase/(4S)-4-hydroxy-2-oxoglutarate aldolase
VASTPEKARRIAAVMTAGPVIPVVMIERAADAVALARALLAGGIGVIEVTLRTPVALDAIRAIAAEVEGIVTGAGTVLDAAQLDAALDAGARFAVAPGAAPKLLDAAQDHELALLPGAASASESMALLERGIAHQKFFPAGAAGGAGYLAALASPLPQVTFCPTGGVTPANARDYLALANVACVGGSWVTPADAIADGDWGRITTLAREASRLG